MRATVPRFYGGVRVNWELTLVDPAVDPTCGGDVGEINFTYAVTGDGSSGPFSDSNTSKLFDCQDHLGALQPRDTHFSGYNQLLVQPGDEGNHTIQYSTNALEVVDNLYSYYLIEPTAQRIIEYSVRADHRAFKACGAAYTLPTDPRVEPRFRLERPRRHTGG